MEGRGRLKCLLDTNIILELILARSRVRECTTLLEEAGRYEFCISDFTLHSVGVYLSRHKQPSIFSRFVKDLVVETGLEILSLSVSDLEDVMVLSTGTLLDFDDAYQYTVAEKYDLILVSFDKDFDRTKRGRKTPVEILQE